MNSRKGLTHFLFIIGSLLSLSACLDEAATTTSSSSTSLSSSSTLSIVNFSITTTSITESATAITATAEIDQISDTLVLAPFTVSGTAANPSDHSCVSDIIVINAGSLTGTYSCSLYSDSEYEADETIIFTFDSTSFPDTAAPGVDRSYTVTIVNDDSSATVDFSAATQSIAEGDSGNTTLTLTANLSATIGANATIPFTIGSGTSTVNQDHDCVDSSITIAAGDTTGSTTCNIVGDEMDESNETIIFTMGTPTHATAGTTTTHTATITDDDATPVVNFYTASSEVNEGNSGTTSITFTVVTDRPSSSTMTVALDYDTGNSTSANPGDHDCADNNITITTGKTSGSYTCNLVIDTTAEGPETVEFDFDAGSFANVTAGTVTTSVITIVDDDGYVLPIWTWISGSSAGDQSGVYGVQDTFTSDNVPGSRTGHQTLIDSNQNLWLFGGNAYDIDGNLGYANDLWTYNTTSNRWSWVSGSNTRQISGNYGTQGTPSTANYPGARTAAAMWIDNNDDIWIFAGYAYDKNGDFDEMNDMWKFDTSDKTWVWLSGADDKDDVVSVYGSKGVESSGNMPPARVNHSFAKDSSGNFWIFGGRDQAGNTLGDLWRYNTTTGYWTWIAGVNTTATLGNYGSLGVAGASYYPGTRRQAILWIDSNDDIWIFGGLGRDGANATDEQLNDLWFYDVSADTWTWLGGSSTNSQNGTYGTAGVFAGSNIPGSRFGPTSWIDSDGNFWLFGGEGNDATSSDDNLADLWKYNPTSNQWTWSEYPNAGLNTSDHAEAGSFGSLGVWANTNRPKPLRFGTSAYDSTNKVFYLFGGFNSGSRSNALWKFTAPLP